MTIVFGTLGPSGSNHDWVARRYLQAHGLSRAKLKLFAEFEPAFTQLLDGDLDFVIQVAVHASVPSTVARYRNRVHLVDTFLSASQAMAVLSRADVQNPTTLGLQDATREYIDVSRWQQLISESSTIDVATGLREGRYDSGITLARFADEFPSELKLEQTIGTVVDPWLVYGRHPVASDQPVIWTDGPASRQYQVLLADDDNE
ncbi:MAG: hypothetical protein AAF732_17020 [Pseudomonadota bacterium]